jgi:hypothetical protein
MSLKEEVGKLVKRELGALERRDRAVTREFAERAEKFSVMSSALRELCEAFDSKSLSHTIGPTDARVEIGGYTWRIAKSDEMVDIAKPFGVRGGFNNFKRKQKHYTVGFSQFLTTSSDRSSTSPATKEYVVEQTQFFAMDGSASETRLDFESETKVLEYLARIIAKEVAKEIHTKDGSKG